MSEISIIVPVYKVEPYLRRCVDSILAQTFTDIEVILVDDGSPDNCPAICDKYAQQDNRVIVIHQEYQGVSVARNTGLNWALLNSNSQWISFVDSDDWVHPRFLEYLHRAATENNVQISVCDYCRESIYEEPKSNVEYDTLKVTSLQLYQHLEKSLLFTVVWNKLYYKSLFEKIRFPVGKISEDTFVSYKLMYKCPQIVFIKHPLYFYYINQTGITSSTYSPVRLVELDALKLQQQFFHEQQATDWEKSCIIRTIRTYAFHIQKCSEFPLLKQYETKLQQELRRLLKSNKKFYKLSLPRDAWISETVYPKRMSFYWKMMRLKVLIYNEGIAHTALRAFVRITKGKDRLK
ncbi:glycosyltransferase family 2 protein [Pseudoflavonifractor capillosus]|uniref:glycosyltransferase family 2 protein n=1 Tax=Pseudoflavonifractor capillosus TaxID=106588 RepID=UPI00031E4E00|nr:glycosyltransferase family 2 protein [Pseudoflavonifractor capillosus]